MKWQFIMTLCGTMAFVLAGCSSAVTEPPVTDTQVIDVSEPSAAEQAIEQEDVAFVNENVPLIALEKKYLDLMPKDMRNEKELSDLMTQLCDEGEQTLFFWTIEQENVRQLWYGGERSYELEAPDETCMEPQQAANIAGRLAKKLKPEAEPVVYLVSLRQNDFTDGRLYYLMAANEYAEDTPPSEQNGICAIILDAVTGELLEYYNYDINFEEAASAGDIEAYAQAGRQELQEYLDLIGKGQQCSAFENGELYGNSVEYKTDVSGAAWYVRMQGGKIENAYLIDLVRN